MIKQAKRIRIQALGAKEFHKSHRSRQIYTHRWLGLESKKSLPKYSRSEILNLSSIWEGYVWDVTYASKFMNFCNKIIDCKIFQTKVTTPKCFLCFSIQGFTSKCFFKKIKIQKE